MITIGNTTPINPTSFHPIFLTKDLLSFISLQNRIPQKNPEMNPPK